MGLNMRIILYTGKGGVGKTSVAAATALRCAERGYRTIAVSTDAAHSLADSFDTGLGSEPVQIAPNLWGHEIDVLHEVESSWKTVQEWIAALLSWRGMNEVVASEMAVLPGMEELASLLNITEYHDSGNYDIVVVDCAPTGETLRLLSFPEVLRWWMEKLFPLERKVATLIRPVVKPILNIPYPDNKVFDSVEDLYRKIDRMHRLLVDRDTSSVRLVLNPEKMVIREAQRTFTYLNLYGYFVDLIICNRIIPDEVGDRYFDSWKESQSRYMQTIDEGFAPLPILNAPLFDREMVGIPMLKLMGEAVFGDDDPAKLFFKGSAQELKKEDGRYVLTLPLPFLDKGDISLVRSGNELIVQAGKHKRNIFLPHILTGLSHTKAKFEDNELRIEFEKG